MRLNRLIISIAVVAVVLSALPSSASSEVTCIQPPTVISCDEDGNPKEEFFAGEAVYIKATGLIGWRHYDVYIQEHSVNVGDSLSHEYDPSGTVETICPVDIDDDGSIDPIMIWADVYAVQGTTYDIVIDAWTSPWLPPGKGEYNPYYYKAVDGWIPVDGIDAVGVIGGGGIAPVPELPTILLTVIGLIGLIALGRRR